VPAGAPTLRVEHRGVLLQRIPCPAPEGSRDLGTIALRAQRVHLRAVGADDRPEPATLWAENWDDDDARALRRFAADGRLVGQWLPTDPGVRCGFGARFADGSEHTVRVLRDEREVVVRRQPCGSLELRVVDPEGCARPAAMFRILPWGRDGEAPHDGAAFASARDRSSHGLFALTDADGRTIVHGIPPGPVLVYFTGDWGTFGHGPGCDGPPPVEQVIHVRRGETASADLVLPRF
jgi:hypothetical protein